MKASDYIVEYLIDQGITDAFGYPGGMVTHLMDSFCKYQDRIKAHVTYHEQSAAFAACGYAQASGKVGVAYATSGPGATNLITGIANAYMDSIPTVFITGQVNSFEQKGDLKVRQRGFQETDIVSIVKPITKYAVLVNDANKLRWYLDKAFYIAQEGRKGPVLLDLAMNVMRMEINPSEQEQYLGERKTYVLNEVIRKEMRDLIEKAKKPVVLIGRGLNIDKEICVRLNRLNLPVVTSMIAIDSSGGLDHYYGFVGAYGSRIANFVIAKSDLVIALGARLDIRQVGARRSDFAPNAQIIRVDIDKEELKYKVHEDEFSICGDAHDVAIDILNILKSSRQDHNKWLAICDVIADTLRDYDDKVENRIVRKISEELIADQAVITTDVGQNQVWIAQSFKVKSEQKILFSGGHGSMGYSLPAAVGAYMASRKPVYCFNGDGGFQMNVQELQFVSQKKLPIKIFVFNNQALGMIRHFQEMYFGAKYFQTKAEGGYYAPDFQELANAYGIDYYLIQNENMITRIKEQMQSMKPCLVEIRLAEDTYAYPKLEYGKPNQDQEPLLPRKIYDELMKLGDE